MVRLPDSATKAENDFAKEWYEATMAALAFKMNFPAITKVAMDSVKKAPFSLLNLRKRLDAVGSKSTKATAVSVQ